MRPMTGKLACLAACLALGLAAGSPAIAAKEEAKKESKDVRTAKQMHVAFTQQMGVHQDIDLQEYVQRVARQYLVKTGRTVVITVPKAAPAAPAKGGL